MIDGDGDVFGDNHHADADGKIDDGCGGVDQGDGDDGQQNDKELRWETTDAETTQLQRQRSLGQGQLTRLLILTMMMMIMIMIMIRL